MKPALAVALLTAFAAGCGGSSPTSPSGMTPMSVTGTWSGSASDSSSSMGAGAMMGQSDVGTMTWQITQSGANVSGTLRFSGMPGGMAGTFSGTMSGEDMTFTLNMPSGSMMSSACAALATGTVHVEWATMTMTGTYGGSNTCSGPFTNGQMTMTHR